MNFIIRNCDFYLQSFRFIARFRKFNRMAFNRNKVFIRYGREEELMAISFCYGDDSIIREREFNFFRSKSEKLDTAVARIRGKILAAALPKLKKKQKKLAVEDADSLESPTLNISITQSGKEVGGDVSNLEAWTDETKLRIGESEYDVVVNGPEVLMLKLPKIILAGYLVYPRISLDFAYKKDSSFTWYRSITKNEKDLVDKNLLCKDQKGESWVLVGNDFSYFTSDEDLGHRLKVVCVPKHGNRCGKTQETVSTNSVVAGPDRCPFEDRHEYTKNLTPVGSFRCVSYNILADLYADSETARKELFPHCPPEFLDFEYRKQLYLKEIIGYNADIICLQEVDRKVFQNDLNPVLTDLNLEGVYNEKGGEVGEGLVCFYRSSKFRLLNSEAVLLKEVVVSAPVLKNISDKVSENEKLKERLLNRTSTLQIAFLESIDNPNKQVLVGNTHLYFSPESDNIRLIQAAICIQYLEHVVKKYLEENPSVSLGLLLCGDFNSCPEFGVLKLMTEGYVPEDCIDWQSCPAEAVPGLPLRHSFSIGSGCGTPPYTNFTLGFNGCLDYIYYDKCSFKVSEVVPLPTHEQVTKHTALPNKEFPSDHIALVCTLTWQ